MNIGCDMRIMKNRRISKNQSDISKDKYMNFEHIPILTSVKNSYINVISKIRQHNLIRNLEIK